jgi:hypothetical protein
MIKSQPVSYNWTTNCHQAPPSVCLVLNEQGETSQPSLSIPGVVLGKFTVELVQQDGAHHAIDSSFDENSVGVNLVLGDLQRRTVLSSKACLF